jgi:hypothetical protein
MNARPLAAAALLLLSACSSSPSSGGDGGGGSDMSGTPDMSPTGPAPYDWPQFGFDAAHSGNNPRETALSAANVASLALAKQVSFPAPVDGPPIYVAAVPTAAGTEDLLIVETTQADLIALDAQTLAQVWMKSHPYAGGACVSSNGGACYTTSEPALDPSRQFVYAYGLDGLVHKHAVSDGAETTTSGWPEVATLKPRVEKGSSDLAVAVAKNGTAYLYVAQSGYPGDAGDYQGHVTTINLTDGSQKVFNTLCSNLTVHFGSAPLPAGGADCPAVQSAVWPRPGVLYLAATDRIYLATGNSTFDPTTEFDWGDSVLAIAADGSGSATGPVDSWTPTDQAALNAADADIGSTGPALLPVPASSPHPHLALQGGKLPSGASAAPLRILDLDDLSGMGGPGHQGGELYKADAPTNGGILTEPTVWVNPADQTVWAFVATGSGLSGLKIDPAAPSWTMQWTTAKGGTSPIVANGILYYAATGAGRQGANSVYALDPLTGSVLWSAPIADAAGGSAAIGGIHWESPIVAHGYLYVTSEHGNSSGGIGDGTGYLSAFTTP